MTLMVSRWKNSRPSVGKTKSATPQFARAIPPAVSREIARDVTGEAWRRRRFRRVNPVRFAVAITTAEQPKWDSSQRDIGMQSNHHKSGNQQAIHKPQQQQQKEQ